MALAHRAQRPRTWVRWVVLAGVAVLLVWTGWIVVRGLIARDELTATLPAVRELREAVVDGRTSETGPLVAELKQHAAAAHDMTHDPVWRITEFVPWVGPNLAAVRQVTEIATTLTDRGIDPLLSAAARFDPEAFAVVDGAIDLAPIVAIQPDVALANDAMADARRQADAIDVGATVGPVRDAVEQMLGMVDEVTGSVDALDRTSHLLPAMLGQDGPRTTLVLIQNNAELRSSGGVSGALALVSATGGKVQLAAQASTTDFSPPFDAPVLPLDAPTASLYGDITGEYIQDVNLPPWFDTSGELAKAMWEQRMGGTVDAVVAVDPVLLSYLLEATGPVQVGDLTLTADTAVATLLSDAYVRYPEPRAQDAFFAAAAQAVFGAVTSGQADAKALVTALVRGGDEGRVRIWNARDDDQEYVLGTTLSGMLPADNSDGPRLGVYLNDGTGAKMDYYLDTRVTLASGVCHADGRPTYRVTVTLRNDAPADAATSLPAYVTGAGAFGVEPGRIKTLVGVYGPVDSDNQGVTDAASGEQAAGFAALDRGRPAVVVPTELGPGDSVTLVYEFLGTARERGPVTVELTPTLNDSETRHRSLSC